jgi:hypothetical protein
VILDWKGLRALMPAIRSQLDELHRSIAERHAGSFPMDRFESEVTQRELVLVLGGGGGSGGDGGAGGGRPSPAFFGRGRRAGRPVGGGRGPPRGRAPTR